MINLSYWLFYDTNVQRENEGLMKIMKIDEKNSDKEGLFLF